MRSEKIAEISLACLQSLRNRSSTSSLVSEISATDLAELRHHHAVQFGKLLPRDHPANKAAPHRSSKDTEPKGRNPESVQSLER